LIAQAIRHQRDEFTSFEQARRQFEREYLRRLLRVTGGNVTHAAKLAERNRTEFYKLLQKHHINPAEFHSPR
jgi:two-component system response regulator GlrR